MDINDIGMAVQSVLRKIKDPNSDIGKALSDTIAETGSPLFLGRGRLGNRFVYLCDSVGRDSETPVKTPMGGNSGEVGGSWPSLASLLSGGKIGHARNASISGENSTQMLARFHTDVTPYRPAVVHIGPGVNDAFQAVPDATYKANIRALIAEVRAINAVPTMQTLTPVTSAGIEQRKRYSRWNSWLLDYAAQNGILIADFHTALVDPATGNLAAAYDKGDGTHPNVSGMVALATTYSNLIAPLLATQPSPGSMWNTDSLNLLNNGMFLGTPDAGGIAPSWTSYRTVTAGTSARSIVSDANVRGGKMQRLTVTGATGENALNQYVNGAGGKFAAGHKLKASTLLSTTGGTRAQLQIACYADGYVNKGYITRYVDQAITRGVMEVEFTVPPATVGIEFIIQTTSGGTGSVDFGNASLRNLTAEGNSTI